MVEQRAVGRFPGGAYASSGFGNELRTGGGIYRVRAATVNCYRKAVLHSACYSTSVSTVGRFATVLIFYEQCSYFMNSKL